MFSNQEAEVSLHQPVRTLDAVRGDKVDTRFIAGSCSLRGDNHLSVIRFHSESNQLGVDAFLSHPTGPVSRLCTSPNDKTMVLSVAENSSEAILWRIPTEIMDHNNEIGFDGEDEGFGGGTKEVSPMEQLASMQLPPPTENQVDAASSAALADITWRGAFDEEPSAMGDVLTLAHGGRLAQWDVSLGTSQLTREISASSATDNEQQHTAPWNVPPRIAWDPHSVDITAVSIGTRIVVTDWRTATGTATELCSSFQCHRYGITDLDFNPNKPNVLATSGQDGLLKFWDLRSPKKSLLVARGGHRHWASRVSYNPFHDQLVISAGTDSLVNLWRVSTISSAPLLTLDEENVDGKSDTSAPNVRVARYEHMDSVYALAWGAADAWVYATAGYDGKVVLNHVPSKEKYKILL